MINTYKCACSYGWFYEIDRSISPILSVESVKSTDRIAQIDRLNYGIRPNEILSSTDASVANSRRKAREVKYLFSPPSVVPSVQ